MRDTRDLTGIWRVQPDPCAEGEARGWPAPAYDTTHWREVSVPTVVDACGPGLAGYEGAAWFQRTIDIPAAWAGRRVTLAFGAVNNTARVWVNGHLVTEHADPFLPFNADVSSHLVIGAENTVVVRADNTRHAGAVPGLQRGWRPFGGILREVTLTAGDPLHLAHAAYTAEADGQFSARLTLVNGRAEAAKAEIIVTVRDAAGLAVLELRTATELGSDTDTTLAGTGIVPNASPWSPADPYLYTAKAVLTVDGQTVDTESTRIGFRTIAVRDGQMLLNGAPLLLTGANRHEDSPRTAACMDPAQARDDLRTMQNLGMNCVRLCHYPHHPATLDLCDELGLLAIDEIPLYWWDGLAEGEATCAAKLATAERQLTALIARDGNHPSVFCWSVSNETKEDRPEVAAGNAALVRLARRLDPTRLAVHVSDHWSWGSGRFDEDDLLCVNAYPSMNGLGQDPAYDLADSTRWWAEKLAALHAQYPEKPILVTEFGLPALETTRGLAVSEDTQAAALCAEFAGMAAPYVRGTLVWCLNDHPWPEEPFLNYLTTSPYGLYTRERRPKAAAAGVRELFTTRQGLPPAPPEEVNPANRHVRMIHPHLRDIPQFAFPAGFTIRPMRPGEDALWLDIHRDAEEHFAISDDLFTRQFGSDPAAQAWRCFFIVTNRDVAVGTLSAWFTRDFHGKNAGRIHWVAIRPAFQGRGLAKPAMTHAMNALAQWHQMAYLDTSTARIPAIKIYLDFGFEPDLSLPDALDAWRAVKAVLPHPALAEIE